MITINLLPPDLRPVERTPLPRLLVVLVGVALGAIGLVFLLFMHASWLPGVRRELEAKTDEVTSLQQQAAEFERLTVELRNITQREQALQQIYRSRTIWWKKLDQLCDLVPSYVGLTGLKFTEARAATRGAAQADAGTLRMECLAAKAEEKRVAAFRRILKGELLQEGGQEADEKLGREFIADFLDGEVLDFGWRVDELTDYPGQPVLKFPLEMKLKPKVAPPQPTRQAARVRPGRAR